MKLLVFGLSVSSAWGNPHATLWRGLIQALASQGHSVSFYERDMPMRAAHRDLSALPHGELVLYSDFADVRKRAAAALQQSDVGIVTAHCPDALAATALLLEAAVPVRAFYALDTPLTLQRIARGESVAYIGPRGLRDFDIVLSDAGGRALDELHRLLGARRVATFYGGVDAHTFSPAAPQAIYHADLSYLGAHTADPQSELEQLFLGPARARPDLTFAVGGAHYLADFAWAANVKYLWQVPVHERSAFFCSARLNLTLSRAPAAAMGYCPSPSLFEAAASGATVITDAATGIQDFYEPDDEILVARDTEDVLAALSLGERELNGIRRRALQRTLAEHTVELRARRLVDLLSDARASDREFEREALETTREV
jgi:spore maturation protein CgeB